eukprot:5984467-Pyramimonas_sp.AAC.1
MSARRPGEPTLPSEVIETLGATRRVWLEQADLKRTRAFAIGFAGGLLAALARAVFEQLPFQLL